MKKVIVAKVHINSHSAEVIRLACLLMKAADSQLTKESDLTYSQFKVLFLLDKYADHSQKEAAQKLELTEAAISRLTETLVRKELIARKVNPDNRRENHLEITSLGKAKLASSWSLLSQTELKLYHDLDPQEVKVFMKVIDQLNLRLEKDCQSQKLRHGQPDWSRL